MSDTEKTQQPCCSTECPELAQRRNNIFGWCKTAAIVFLILFLMESLMVFNQPAGTPGLGYLSLAILCAATGGLGLFFALVCVRFVCPCKKHE